MISDKETEGDRVGESESESEETGVNDRPMVRILPSIAGLFALFISVLLIGLTLAPAMWGAYTTLEVYTFIVRLCALWAGLVWLSASIYLSLITGAREFSTEIWLAFIVGALMSYQGLAGEFVTHPYWIGVRALLYTFISLIAVALIANIQRRLGADRPAVTLVEMWRRAKRQIIRRNE